MPDRSRELAEAVRTACVRVALDAYEDAGLSGLCHEGRWECAVEAVRMLELEGFVRSRRGTPPADPRPDRQGNLHPERTGDAMSERLTEAELREIETHLAEGTGQDGHMDAWLRRLVTEVRHSRGGAAEAEDIPLKNHGDALMDGSGNRHGLHDPDARSQSCG